jgi:broad-specificity NMP kinase
MTTLELVAFVLGFTVVVMVHWVVVLRNDLAAYQERLKWEGDHARERRDLFEVLTLEAGQALRRAQLEADTLRESREQLVQQIVSMQNLGFVHVPRVEDEPEEDRVYAITNELELEVERERMRTPAPILVERGLVKDVAPKSNWFGSQTDPL